MRSSCIEALVRAQCGLAALWTNAPGAPRLTHGDVTPSKVVRSRGPLAAIDFQDVTWGHVEQDVALAMPWAGQHPAAKCTQRGEEESGAGLPVI